jgi:predicted PurR-regulated permease PerM
VAATNVTVSTTSAPQSPWWWFKLRNALIALLCLAALYWVVDRLGTVIIMVVIASLVAFILDPMVNWLSHRMPRGAAIAIAYLGVIAVVAVILLLGVPAIIRQIQALDANLPAIRADIQQRVDDINTRYSELPDQLREQLTNLGNSLSETGKKTLQTFFATAVGIFGWMAKGVIMLVLSIYLLMDKRQLCEGILSLVPQEAKAETIAIVAESLEVLRAYLRGQIVVIGFVAVCVTVFLFFVGMPYALTIGTVAGILEVIPYFGAVAGAVPAVLWAFAFKGSMGLGLMTIGFFVALNQCEGHIVIPLVMGRELEMRPLAVLLSLLVGVELGGIVGLIVAVPVARILQVFVEHGIKLYRESRRLAEENAGPDEVVHVEVDVTPKAAPLTTRISEADMVLPPPSREEVARDAAAAAGSIDLTPARGGADGEVAGNAAAAGNAAVDGNAAAAGNAAGEAREAERPEEPPAEAEVGPADPPEAAA